MARDIAALLVRTRIQCYFARSRSLCVYVHTLTIKSYRMRNGTNKSNYWSSAHCATKRSPRSSRCVVAQVTCWTCPCATSVGATFLCVAHASNETITFLNSPVRAWCTSNYALSLSLSLSLVGLSVTISMLLYRELLMMNRRKIPLGTRERAGTCVVYKQLCSLSLSLCLSVTISMLIYREWLMMMNRRKIPLGTRERAIGALELGHSITPDPVGVVDPSLPSTSSPSRWKPRRLPTDAPPPSSPAPCSPASPSRHARHHRQPRTSDALLRNVVLSPRAH